MPYGLERFEAGRGVDFGPKKHQVWAFQTDTYRSARAVKRPDPTMQIIRSNTNAHRYICFVDGRIRVLLTHEKDFSFDVASLFGWLNQRLARCGPLSAFRNRLFSRVVSAMLSAILLCPVAFALPTGWEVVSGNVQFETAGNTLNVTSASSSAIINYQSFNLAAGETINFNMLLSGSSILNNVIGGGASNIAGRINANGQVFLVNTAGINFANSAQVNAGSLIASSLALNPNDYLAGRYVFHREGEAAAVHNEGDLRADHYIALIGSAVKNDGSITAPQASLAVGDQVSVAVGSDMQVKVTVDQSLKDQVEGYQDAVSNTGSINATRLAELQANVEGQLYQRAINNSGRIQAMSVAEENGSIVLTATPHAGSTDGQMVENSGTLVTPGGDVHVEGDLVLNSGDIDVSSTVGSGGNIAVLGDAVILNDDAQLNASGATGGGEIHIGGDYQGADGTRTADYTVVEKDVMLKANAFHNGDGGEVVVWSDGQTRFDGQISAQGGTVSGDGGRAEVSGKQVLQFGGGVDLSAAHGEKGSLLLDPENLYIIDPTLWFDASTISGNNGDPISSWTNSAGNGINATQGTGGSQPTLVTNGINGLNTVRFDGVDDTLSANYYVDATNGVTYYLVTRYNGLPGAGQYALSGTQSNQYMYVGVEGSTGKTFAYFGNLTGFTNVGPNISTGTPYLYNLTGTSGATASLYLNGQSLGTQADAGGAGAAGDPFVIGGVRLGRYMNADVSEVMVFDQQLPTAERLMIEQYLDQRYNIGTGNPGNVSLMTRNQIQTLSQTSNVILQADNDIVVGQMNGTPLTMAGGSSLRLQADADGNGVGTLTVKGRLATGGGDILLNAAQIDINQTVDAGTGSIRIGSSIAKDIHLGAVGADNDSAGVLDISRPELELLRGDRLVIGDIAQTSNVSIVGDVDVSGRAGDFSAYDLEINTAGNFDSTGGRIFLGRDALYFDGVDDYAEVTDPGASVLDVNGNVITLAGWVRTEDLTEFTQILNKENKYEIALDPTGELWGSVNPTWIEQYSNTNSSQQDWHHVAMVDTGTAIEFYMDGALVQSIALADGAIGANDQALRIGAREQFVPGSNGFQYFKGMLDDLQVYDTNLSGGQISALYNNGFGVASTAQANLVGGWNFTGSAAGSVADFSGNGNAATIYGTPDTVGARSFTLNAMGNVTTGDIQGDGADITVNYGNSLTQSGLLSFQGTNGSLNITDLTPPAPAPTPTPAPAPSPPPTSGSGPDTGPLVNAKEGSNGPVAPAVKPGIPAADIASDREDTGLIPPGSRLEQAELIAIQPDGSIEFMAATPIESGFIPVANDVAITPARLALELNADANQVRVVETGSNRLLADIPVGHKPVDVALSSDGNRAFVISETDATLSIIDLARMQVVETIPLQGVPAKLDMSVDGTVSVRDAAGQVLLKLDVTAGHTHTLPMPSFEPEALGEMLSSQAPDPTPGFTAEARKTQSQAITGSIDQLVNAYFAQA